jgi:hypothetical protein
MEVSPRVAAKPFGRKRSGKRKGAISKPYSDEPLIAVYAASQRGELEHLIECAPKV